MNEIWPIISPYVMIIAFLIIVVFLLAKSKHGYSKVSKNELAQNNEFIIKNKERVSVIFDQKYKELEPLKNKIKYLVLLLVVSMVLSFIIQNKYFTYISIGISGVLLIITSIEYNSNSNKKFTEIAIEVLHDFDSNLVYKPEAGFSYSEYKLCRFPEDCDRFYSEDMITNSKNNFQFADILVESEHEDKDHHTYYVTEYAGSLAKIPIKNVNCKLFLGGMKTYLFQKDNYKKIKFENDEFNKLFNAYADDELIAYKILTPDVMEEFVKIKNTSFGDIDIRIMDDKLYIRFLSGNGFDSSALGKDADKENLCQSIAVLEDVMKTMERVKKIIEEKNVD